MSFIGSMLSNDKGSGFQAQSAPVINPLGTAAPYTQNANHAYDQQLALINALQAQNGIQNQSNVYNQLGGIAAGTGPNPAQAMLNQQTGNNIAQQAALMAGQRGAGANAGLIARQAGMQGGALQQNAIGQGATLQAQQALNALGQQSGIAGQQIGNQVGAIGNANQFAQAQQNNVMNSVNAFNNANINNAQQQNTSNAAIAAGNQKAQQGIASGLVGGLGSALGLGSSAPSSALMSQSGLGASGGADSFSAPAFGSSAPGGGGMLMKAQGGTISSGPRSSFGKSMMASGGKASNVQALVSPGEIYLPPAKAQAVAQGKASPMSGEKIPGKPQVGGTKNSYANDTVHKTLQSGGIVLPRSVTQAKDAPEKARAFVEAIMAKKRAK